MDSSKVSQQIDELRGADSNIVVDSLIRTVDQLTPHLKAERLTKLRALLMDFIIVHTLAEAREILASFQCEHLSQALKLSPVNFSLLIRKLKGSEEGGVPALTPYALLTEFRISWSKHATYTLSDCGDPECIFCGERSDFLMRVDAALEKGAPNG